MIFLHILLIIKMFSKHVIRVQVGYFSYIHTSRLYFLYIIVGTIK